VRGESPAFLQGAKMKFKSSTGLELTLAKTQIDLLKNRLNDYRTVKTIAAADGGDMSALIEVIDLMTCGQTEKVEAHLLELYGSEPMDKMNEEITELIEWVSREDPEIKK
jgi:hypothetical protein